MRGFAALRRYFLPPQQQQVQVPSAQLPPQPSQQPVAVSSIVMCVSPPSCNAWKYPTIKAERDKNRGACESLQAAAMHKTTVAGNDIIAHHNSQEHDAHATEGGSRRAGGCGHGFTHS